MPEDTKVRQLRIAAHWQYGMSRYVAYDLAKGEHVDAGYGYNTVGAAVIDFLEKHGKQYGISLAVRDRSE